MSVLDIFIAAMYLSCAVLVFMIVHHFRQGTQGSWVLAVPLFFNVSALVALRSLI